MKNEVHNEGIANALLKLRTLKPHVCGMEHHIKPDNVGNICPREIRNRNPLCSHTEQTILQEVLVFCNRIELITYIQGTELLSIVSEAQILLSRLDVIEATHLESFLNWAEILKDKRRYFEVSLNQTLQQKGSHLILTANTDREGALRYLKERQQKLGAPIELVRQLLITLLETAQKNDAPETLTQTQATDFLAQFATDKEKDPAAKA